MVNMPIDRPWQMIAVDVLKVPTSTSNNKYLLVIKTHGNESRGQEEAGLRDE